MFGVSFGEAVLLVLLAIVVIGPRDLPKMMRSLGRNVNKLRRAALDLRDQSGIDEILRTEGIHREVLELQKLATGRIMELGLDEPLMAPGGSRPKVERDAVDLASDPYATRRSPPRQREYPAGGPDSFDALSEEVAMYQPDAGSDTAAADGVAGGVIETTGESVPETPAAPAAKKPAIEGAVARGSLPDDDDENHAAA